MIPHNKPTLGKEEQKAAERVIASNWLAQGREVEQFENEICAFLGLPDGHAVAFSSGTAALFIALTIIGAKEKQVALPVYACSALRNATAWAGGKEVLIDSATDFPNIDMDSVKASGAEIAVVAHMFGVPQKVDRSKNQLIVEDCAQAIGAHIDGVAAGLQGDIGIFSFYATKLLTSGGQGGILVASRPDWIEAARDYRDFDSRRDKKIRFNLQMTDLQGAIGREQLKKLPSFIERRAAIYEKYKMAGLDLLQPCNATGKDDESASRRPVAYRAIAKTPHPGRTIGDLLNKGIKSIIPVEDWELLGEPAAFENANWFASNLISLPIFPSLSDSEVQFITDQLSELALSTQLH